MSNPPSTTSHPHREPFRSTVTRNVLIALVATIVIAVGTSHSPRPMRWPIALLLALWPTFGGHLVELFYLGIVRPRLSVAASTQRAAWLLTWFVGGCLLGLAMMLTARALGAPFAHWPAWWLAGPAFIAIELVAHAGLQMKARPSFYNGLG